MEPRRLLLKAMLWSLGFAAVAGVCGVLVAGRDVMWRLAGTGVAAAVASGLLMAGSRLVDREATRPAGLLAMAIVIAEFLLSLVLIWELAPWRSGYVDEEKISFTVAALGLAGLPAVFFLSLVRFPAASVSGWTGVGLSVSCLVAMFLGTWWNGGSGYVRDNWWATAGILGGCGLLAVAGLTGGPLTRRAWRWAGVVSSAVAAGMAITGLWLELGGGEEVLACVLGVASVSAYWNLALLVPLASSQRWVRWVSMAGALATAALVDFVVVSHERVAGEAVQRAAAAAGIVAACGGMSLLVLARINRRVAAPEASDLTQLVLVCPHCRRQQTIPTGGAACAQCGLRIHVRLEEPRCPACNYLLYGLTSDRCPECGTPIGSRTGAGGPAYQTM